MDREGGRERGGLGLRGEEDLITAEPADARRVTRYLEPVVVLVEDAEFCAIVDGEGGVGVFKWTAADRDVTRSHDGGFGRASVGPGNGNASAEQNRRDDGGGKVESERTFESGTPFAEGEEEEAEPESGGGEKGPFVEGQFAEETFGAAGRERRSLNLVASELEVGADVGIARSDSLGLEIRSDGFADLAGFEVGVAQVVVEGDGFFAGVKDVFVSGDGFGKFARVIEVIGGVEGRVPLTLALSLSDWERGLSLRHW